MILNAMIKKVYFNNTNDKVNEYPTIITFFTDNWEYKKFSMDLIKKCNELKLNYYVEERDNTNSYLHNTQIKPTFINSAFNNIHEDVSGVLWIDADGILSALPDFFKDFKYEFAAKRMNKRRNRTWHVGTIYLKNNDKAKELVKQWILYTRKGNVSDEYGLDLLWKSGYFLKKKISFVEDIPQSYFNILNKTDRLPSDAVISHRLSKDPIKIQQKRNKMF